MSVLSPYPAIGWSPDNTASGDPRRPVRCSWCLGRGAYLERLDLFRSGTHVRVRCANCSGKGTVLIERRRRPR